MVHAEIPDETIYPILLPKKSHFTSLLIKEYHQKLFHSGVSHTLAQLRNEYWIPQGRAEVKKAIHGCGICKRFQGGPFKLPSMSPWPGLDYFGPQDESSKEKVWVSLFNCVTVRAIHFGTDKGHDCWALSACTQTIYSEKRETYTDHS